MNVMNDQRELDLEFEENIGFLDWMEYNEKNRIDRFLLGDFKRDRGMCECHLCFL